MAPKLLFLIGIVGVHGVLAAGMAESDPRVPRIGMVCHPVDAPWPDFTPPRMLVTSAHWLHTSDGLVPIYFLVDTSITLAGGS